MSKTTPALPDLSAPKSAPASPKKVRGRSWPVPAMPRLPELPPELDLSKVEELQDLNELGVSEVIAQLDAVQSEVEELRSEVNLLRRRDETLNFYLHRLDEELRLAARIQQDFLPRELPQLGPVHFHTLFRPAGYVSGDIYDVARLDERRIGFYVADAVGHGMPAALLTMFIKRALVTKQVLPPGNPAGTYRLLCPSEAMHGLNAALVEQQLTQATFATALYGTIDVDTLEMQMTKAGHPSPLLINADGSHEWLDLDGSLLGIFPDEIFATRKVQLSPGDRVVIYSDGIEFAFPDHGIAEPRWSEELLSRKHLSPEQLLNAFAEQVDLEGAGLVPRDDLTMMVIEIKKTEAA
jgi:sigma-B regulation protein RsbU (phosphoserine phosphatase)